MSSSVVFKNTARTGGRVTSLVLKRLKKIQSPILIQGHRVILERPAPQGKAGDPAGRGGADRRRAHAPRKVRAPRPSGSREPLQPLAGRGAGARGRGPGGRARGRCLREHAQGRGFGLPMRPRCGPCEAGGRAGSQASLWQLPEPRPPRKPEERQPPSAELAAPRGPALGVGNRAEELETFPAGNSRRLGAAAGLRASGAGPAAAVRRREGPGRRRG